MSQALDALEQAKKIVKLKHYRWHDRERIIKFGTYRERPEREEEKKKRKGRRKLEYIELGKLVKTESFEDINELTHIGIALKDNLVERGRICPECDSGKVLYDLTAGETDCGDCGLVMEEKEIVSDYRNVSPPRDPFRFDYWDLRKLRKKWPSLYRYLLSKEERDLLRFLAGLRRICERTNAPLHVKRLAYSIYRAGYSDGLLRQGVKKEPFIKAALIVAFNTLRIPFRIEMVSNSEKEEEDVRRAVRRLCSSDRVVSLISPLKQAYGAIKPHDCLLYIVRNLNAQLGKKGRKPLKVSEQELLLKSARRVLRVLSENEMTRGRSPFLVAAVALYDTILSQRVHISLVGLAKAAGISSETMCRYYGELTRQVATFVTKSSDLPAEPLRLGGLADILQHEDRTAVVR